MGGDGDQAKQVDEVALGEANGIRNPTMRLDGTGAGPGDGLAGPPIGAGPGSMISR